MIATISLALFKIKQLKQSGLDMCNDTASGHVVGRQRSGRLGRGWDG